MKHFFLDPIYISSVVVKEEVKFNVVDARELPPWLVHVFDSPIETISHKDHPEFDAFRRDLARQGYISIQENSWNGDRVLMSFSLNDMQFDVGDTFYCAAALQNMINAKHKNNQNGH